MSFEAQTRTNEAIIAGSLRTLFFFLNSFNRVFNPEFIIIIYYYLLLFIDYYHEKTDLKKVREKVVSFEAQTRTNEAKIAGSLRTFIF